MSDKARGSKSSAKQSAASTTKPVKAATATNSTGAANKPAESAKKSAAKTAEAAKPAKKSTRKTAAAAAKGPRTTKATTNAVREPARPASSSAVRTVVEPADTAEELPPRSVDSSHAEFVAATSLAPLANPLRDRQDRRLPHMPEPCALVVFGITGDLAQKKLLPAVYDIANRGLLPANFVLIGLARRDWGDGDFAALAHDAAKEHARTPWDEGVWKRLANNIKFVPGSFDDDEAFDRLARTLTELSDSHGIIGNAAFYLSIPPAFFETVLRQIERTGMADNHRAGGWRRVVVEKPFGHDLPSSKRLNDLVDDVFTWRDVYRIDHYLGKETVQNLFAFRFANTLFEPVWNSHYVDSVQITMAEDVGIGGRAAFYDKTGAARDVLQNHLLQLLALTAMEEPVRFIPSAIRTEKLKVLRAVSLPADLRGNAIRGQYKQGWLAGERAVGYLQEDDVPDDSATETFAAIKLHIETRRWAGVPFYLRTGKRLPRRVTEIALTFRQAPHLPFAPTDTDELGHNQLVIRVQPDEGVTLRFGSKVPGTVMEVRDVAMDFLYGETFTEGSPEAYERLLLDVLLGDATLFPLNEEVEASWAVVDQLEEFWAGQTPFAYRAGEWGPPEADQMLARDGRNWRRP